MPGRWRFGPDAIVVQTLCLLNLALGAFLLWTAYTERAIFTGPDGRWVVWADVFAGSVLLALGALALWRRPPASWGHPWALLTVLLATFTSAVTLAVVRDGSSASNLALVLMGAGMVFLSVGWYAVAVLVVAVTWLGLSRALDVTGVAGGDFFLEVSAIISAAVFAIRWHAHQQLVALERDLRSARDTAYRSHRELDQFTATLGHDLQAPLTALRLQMSAVRAGLRKNDPSRAEHALDAMEQISQETGEFVQAILKYARFGSQAPDMSDVDLSAVMKDVSHYVHESIRAADGRLIIHDLPRVRADIGHVQQLFTLLLINAVQHRRPDTKLEIEVSGEVVGDACRIAVQDNGQGFDGLDPDGLFVPFAHGRSDGRLGHGLGLATCRRIVERNGGAIEAERAEQGARFIVTLPATRA